MTCIFDTFFSIYSSHYLGGFANIFRTKEERRKGSMIMGLVTLFSGVFIRVVVIGNVLVYGDPSSFVRAALLTAVVCVICLLLFIPGIYENEFVKNRYLQIYEFLETQKLPYFKLLKITFKQKNYMIFLVAFTLFQTAQTLNRASELFMLKEVLKADLSIMVIVGFVLMITIIPSIFAWSYIAKKIGHANVYTICLFAFGIGYLLWMLIASVTNYVLIVVYMGIATGSYISIIFSVLADTNDEVVNAAGRHVEASLMGIRTFFLRVAYLLTGAIIAGVHIATGYVPGASTQTELALIGIRIHTGGFPAIFCLIAGILMLKFYDLKGEKKEALTASLRKKGL